MIPMAVLATAWATSGCGKDEVRVYQAPREVPVTAVADRGGSGAAPASASGPGGSPGAATEPSERAPVPWTVPAGWEEKPASGMRVASYAVKRPDGRSADISVVALGGGSGGEQGETGEEEPSHGAVIRTHARCASGSTPGA